MANVDIQTEQETGRGWVYQAEVQHAGQTTNHRVTLAWVDHELWSGGRVAPSIVVEAVIAFIIERGREVPASFDAATVRRWYPEVDRELAGRF